VDEKLSMMNARRALLSQSLHTKKNITDHFEILTKNAGVDRSGEDSIANQGMTRLSISRDQRAACS
jgi:hypothetical protein